MAFGINTFQANVSNAVAGMGANQAMEDIIKKATAAARARGWNITEDDVRTRLQALNNPQLQSFVGLDELTQIPFDIASQEYGNSSGGGGGSYSLGVDPAQEYNQTMQFNREQKIADFIGLLISEEVQRKGLALSTGADLIKQYHDAMAGAAPAGLKVYPGFEVGGENDRIRAALKLPENPMAGPARNLQMGKIPFSTISDNLNEFQNMTPESQIEKYKPLIESMYPEKPPLETIQTSGSWSGGGGGMEPLPPEDGVSPEIAQTLLNAMNSRVIGDPKMLYANHPQMGAKPIGDPSKLHGSQYTKEEIYAYQQEWKARRASGKPSAKWIEEYVKNYRLRKKNRKNKKLGHKGMVD